MEDLSNELLYEVFDYLDGWNIYQAFGRLNNRFDNLLSDPSLFLQIILLSGLKTNSEHYCREVIMPNQHRVRSLKIFDDCMMNQFLDYCEIDASFTCLESIVLNSISNQYIFMILPSLKSLPCLFALTIDYFGDFYWDRPSLYRLIFDLPHLKYCRLELSEQEGYEMIVPMPIDQKSSTIERLFIKHYCSFEEITSLLLHTPYAFNT